MQLLAEHPGTLGVPAASLANIHHYDIRFAAPSSSVVASDDHHTILVAGGRGEYRIPWHAHDCMMIVMPIRGAINYRDETSPGGTCLSEERFVVVPELMQHAGEADDTLQIVLYLTAPVIRRIALNFGAMNGLTRRTRRAIFFPVTREIRMLQWLCTAVDGTHATLKASRSHLGTALLLHVLAQIERGERLPIASGSSHGQPLVRDMCSFIDLRLSERVSLDEISREFRLSRRHTTRLFRRWTGLSIAQYCDNRRLERARLMLANTDLPVGEIAWRVGFVSGSALARAMRRTAGVAPSAIRRRARH